jgi:hypothetical protein
MSTSPPNGRFVVTTPPEPATEPIVTEDLAAQILEQYLPPTPTPNPTRRSLPPLPKSSVVRYRLGAAILLLILLGVGSSLWATRPQGRGVVLPNAPDPNATASPSPTPSASPAPIPQLDTTVAARNDALDRVLQEVAQQEQAITSARRDFLLDKAYAQVKKDGTPIEVSLLRELNRQVGQLRRIVGKGGELTGKTNQIGQARALIGDAKAVALALQTLWTDPSAKPDRHRIAPAVLTKTLIDLAELSEVVRAASVEQQLRNQATGGKPHERLPAH